MNAIQRYLAIRVLCAFVLGVALAASAGMAAGIGSLHSWGGKVGMAYPTAACCVALAIAVWLTAVELHCQRKSGK